jgi:hypothetical protein
MTMDGGTQADRGGADDSGDGAVVRRRRRRALQNNRPYVPSRSVAKVVWIPGLILSFCAFARTAQAATYTAASCNLSDVQTALNKEAATPVNGDIVVIPAGTCTWNGSISENTSVTLTIQGSTTISTNCATPPTSTAACTAADSTVIIDGRTNGTAGNEPIFSFNINGSGSQELRITGITWSGGSDTLYHGVVGGGGSNSSGQLRVDHCHFMSYYQAGVRISQPATFGVFDHNVFDANSDIDNAIQVFGQNEIGFNEWNEPTGFGTANFTFIENNTLNIGFANDCNGGGRYVYRHNVLNSNNNASVQSHATGSINNPATLGCRAWEIYANDFSNTQSGGAYTAEFDSSGAGLSWGNASTGYDHLIALIADRDDNETYTQTAPANGWGYCGTTQTGSASDWDGNVSSNGSNGWPCLAQLGRGKGDLLSGVFPTLQDNTDPGVYTGTWPHQYLEPIYSWMENFTPVNGSSLSTVRSSNNNIQANRDYFLQVGGVQTSPTSPFSGANGTGWGTAANRPTTCTAGPGGTAGVSPTGSYGVSYFATDANGGQGELYVCTATNTWTGVYTPYCYPHPLVSGIPCSGETMDGGTEADGGGAEDGGAGDGGAGDSGPGDSGAGDGEARVDSGRGGEAGLTDSGGATNGDGASSSSGCSCKMVSPRATRRSAVLPLLLLGCLAVVRRRHRAWRGRARPVRLRISL